MNLIGSPQDFDLDIYFHMTWTDPRLVLPFDNLSDPLTLQGGDLDKIWVPDLYFPNAKSTYEHRGIVDNKLVKIWPAGRVRYSARSVPTNTYTCTSHCIY